MTTYALTPGTVDTYDNHHNGAIVSTHALTTLMILAPPKTEPKKGNGKEYELKNEGRAERVLHTD